MYSNGNIIYRYGNGVSSAGSMNTSGTDYHNAWHLVTVTFDGTISTLYVDGVQKVSQSTPTFAYSTGAASAWLGGSNGVNSFSGTLDDVRFYNRVLSSEEITNLYNNTNITTTGAIFYFPFEEGVGPNTIDSFSNNGTTSVSPWKTLSMINTFPFQPGDSVLLKR